MNSHLKGTLITLIGVLIITPDSLLIRLINTDSASLSVWRGILTFITTTAYLLIIEKISFWQSLKKFNYYDCIGLIFFVLSTVLFVYAINNSSVANTLILLSTAPFFAAILSFFFLREKITLAMLIGIIFCFIGVFIIISEELFYSSSTNTSPFSWLAFFSALFCALSIAANFTLSRSEKQSNIILSFALSGIFATLICLPFANNLLQPLESLHWLLIDALIIFPISFIMMLIGARYIPSPYSSMMFQLEIFLGPLWVWLAIGEYPGLHTFIGGSIIITAILAVNLIQLKNTQRL